MTREYHFGDEKRRSIDCTVDVDPADGWDGSSAGRNGDLNRARRWDAAVTMLNELHPFGFTILVYEPPATGSPWLVVCVRPPTDIVGVENYLTAEDAHQRVAELSHEFVSRVAQGR